jgi:hypothetical protein
MAFNRTLCFPFLLTFQELGMAHTSSFRELEMVVLSALAIFIVVLHAKLSKAPHYEITISVNM